MIDTSYDLTTLLSHCNDKTQCLLLILTFNETQNTQFTEVIKFVSDLRQVSGFLRFPPPIKLKTTI